MPKKRKSDVSDAISNLTEALEQREKELEEREEKLQQDEERFRAQLERFAEFANSVLAEKDADAAPSAMDDTAGTEHAAAAASPAPAPPVRLINPTVRKQSAPATARTDRTMELLDAMPAPSAPSCAPPRAPAACERSAPASFRRSSGSHQGVLALSSSLSNSSRSIQLHGSHVGFDNPLKTIQRDQPPLPAQGSRPSVEPTLAMVAVERGMDSGKPVQAYNHKSRESFDTELAEHGLYNQVPGFLLTPKMFQCVALASLVLCNTMIDAENMPVTSDVAVVLGFAQKHSGIQSALTTASLHDILKGTTTPQDTPALNLIALKCSEQHIVGSHIVWFLYSPDRNYTRGGLLFPAAKGFAWSVGHTLVRNAMDDDSYQLRRNLTSYLWPQRNNRNAVYFSLHKAFVLTPPRGQAKRPKQC